jgi:hypothetical protein
MLRLLLVLAAAPAFAAEPFAYACHRRAMIAR